MKAEFDFETKTVMLNSGYEMPINGLGTYSLHGDECINSVKSALSNGVRLIAGSPGSDRRRNHTAGGYLCYDKNISGQRDGKSGAIDSGLS